MNQGFGNTVPWLAPILCIQWNLPNPTLDRIRKCIAKRSFVFGSDTVLVCQYAYLVFEQNWVFACALYISSNLIVCLKRNCIYIHTYMFVCPELIEEPGQFLKLIFGKSGQNFPPSNKLRFPVEICHTAKL